MTPEEGGHRHVIHALRKISAYLLWENVRESFQVSSPSVCMRGHVIVMSNYVMSNLLCYDPVHMAWALPGAGTSRTYPKIWCTPLQNNLPASLLNYIVGKSCTSKHRASSAGMRWGDIINRHKHSKLLQLHCISHKALQLHVHAHVNTDHDAD